MSIYYSNTPFESTALIPVPNPSPSPDPDPQFPSQLNDDLTIGIDGLDEFKMKLEETTMDEPGFENWLDFSSVCKDDIKFPDTSNLGEVNAITQSDALSSQQFLSIVFGDNQVMAPFPDLQLTNDVFVAANKKSSVNIFPVRFFEKSKLIVEYESFSQCCRSCTRKFGYV
jgi:hypothetical protein